MRHADLESARAHLCVVRDLLSERKDAGEDCAVLGAAGLVLGSISRSMPDCLVQQGLLELWSYLTALFSANGPEMWSRPPLSGAEYLRLQVFKTLNRLDARLRTIQSMRSSDSDAQSARSFGAGLRAVRN
jgi:hypothetical protein